MLVNICNNMKTNKEVLSKTSINLPLNIVFMVLLEKKYYREILRNAKVFLEIVCSS